MKNTSTEVPMQAQERIVEAMDVGEIEDLPKLFISPAEKFMDEFDGNTKDLKGLFKVPKEMSFEANLHQQNMQHGEKPIRKYQWRNFPSWNSIHRRRTDW